MDDLKRYFKKKCLRLVLRPFRIFPIKKNQILMINDVGYNYSCNLKAITEYLMDKHPNKLNIVFSVKDIEKNSFLRNKGILPIKFNSILYFYYAMTSKVIITNSGGYSYIPLRDKQCVINTHHGGGAYKTAGIDMFGESYFFRKDMELQAKQTSVFLSTNRKFTEVISKACCFPKEIFWEIGMPRNDILLKNDSNLKTKIRNSIGLLQGEKLVLYAPTYRKPDDNYFKGSIAISYDIDVELVCNALKTRFGGEWRFAYRLHPCVENKNEYIVNGAIDLSEYEDMQDLLLVADVLINDFSSSFWDYMLTGKPAFMYAPDLQHYIETTKVYTPVEKWPFPKAETNNQLIENILNFDEKKYMVACEQHYKMLGGCETGQATKLLCEKIMDECR